MASLIPKTTKKFLLLLVPIFIALWLLYLSISLRVTKSLTDQYLHQEHLILESEVHMLGTIFQDLSSDLFSLVGQNEIDTYLNGDNTAAVLIANEWKNFAERHQQYDQIRFLNSSGVEKIRVNFDGTSAKIVDQAELQNKANRDYFKEAITLNRGELFVSPFDLNIENNRVETPWKPMIRIATPIFDLSGDKRGVIILNYLGAELLETFKVIGQQTTSRLALLNNNGFWLHGAANQQLWSFMFGKDVGFHTDFPESWESIKDVDSGKIVNNEGLFTFRTIHPLKDSWKATDNPPKTDLTNTLIDGDGYTWKIVSLITNDNYENTITKNLTPIRISFLAFTLFATIFCWFLAKVLHKQQQTRQKLIEATSDAERANSAKSEFLAQMSHDIRTPMTGILGMSEFLLESNLDADQKEKVRIIYDSGSTLLEVINDILDLSKVEAGHFEVNPEPFRPRDLMKELIKILEPEAQAKGLNLHCTYSTSLPEWIEADRLRIYQITMNLISNAIRYTDQGEVEVQVTGKHQGDFFFLYVSIRDTGVGVKKEELLKIFEPFVQASGPAHHKHTGTGLGLAIVKKLVHRMGGEILVKSTYGEGTTFTFWTEAKVIDIAPIEPSHNTNISNEVTAETKILLAEDNLVNARIITMILEREGYQLTTVTNGEEALKILPCDDIKLILLDIDMPVMDGIETIQIVREREKNTNPKTPIIAITAHAIQETRQTFVDAGFDAILTKPIDRKELIQTVHQYINQNVE